MIDNRLKEYFCRVSEFRLAPNPQHKAGILNGRIPNTIEQTKNPWTKKLLRNFQATEQAKTQKKAQ